MPSVLSGCFGTVCVLGDSRAVAGGFVEDLVGGFVPDERFPVVVLSCPYT